VGCATAGHTACESTVQEAAGRNLYIERRHQPYSRMSASNVRATIGAEALGHIIMQQPGAWAFETLWQAAGSSRTRAKLNIVDTVLFINGRPRKWVATHPSGFLAQKRLPDPSDYEGEGGEGASVAGKHTEAYLAACFSVIRKSFKRYLAKLDTEATADRPFVLAWYRDGRQDILKMRDFDKLCRQFLWTAELAALQPYADAQSLHVGLFRRTHIRTGMDRVRKNVMGEIADGNLVLVQKLIGDADGHRAAAAERMGPEEVNYAIDGITDRLAHVLQWVTLLPGATPPTEEQLCVDHGFDITAPEDAGPTYSARSTESGVHVHDEPTCKVRVVSLTAHYYTSTEGRLWLSHVSSLYTQQVRQPQEPTAIISEKLAEQLAMEVRAAVAHLLPTPNNAPASSWVKGGRAAQKHACPHPSRPLPLLSQQPLTPLHPRVPLPSTGIRVPHPPPPPLPPSPLTLSLPSFLRAGGHTSCRRCRD
jgi:hypothetical protein